MPHNLRKLLVKLQLLEANLEKTHQKLTRKCRKTSNIFELNNVSNMGFPKMCFGVVWETRGPYGARWAPEGGTVWSSVPKSCKCDT